MIDEAWQSDIKTAVEVMRRGGVILYPTDTVWGIGCDARNEKAVERIFKIKQRDDAKAMITLVDSERMLESVVEEIPEVAYQLIEVTDKPLTIIYDRARGVADNLTGSDGSLAVRVTGESFSAALCRAMRGPVVSTSANISGQPTPLCFTEIPAEIREAVDCICLSRRDEAPSASPSGIIKLSQGGLFKVIR